jgi:FdhD protein
MNETFNAEQPDNNAGFEIIECRRLRNNRFINSPVKLAQEKELTIYINGAQFAVAAVTPVMEREFVTGYLFGQGFISGAAEIESLAIDDNSARVTIKDLAKIRRKIGTTGYRIVSGGGKGAFSEENIPKITSGVKIKKDNIYTALDTVFKKADLYKNTGGVHAAGLFTPEGNLICLAEDMGRHNTLDKLIGYAVINKIDCSNTYLASTGRMASEMVIKICRAKIPVAATKTAITGLGLEIGANADLTIVGFVRNLGTKMNTDMETRITTDRSMKIYTNPARIILQ